MRLPLLKLRAGDINAFFDIEARRPARPSDREAVRFGHRAKTHSFARSLGTIDSLNALLLTTGLSCGASPHVAA